jgi:hypothetical protein
MGESERRLATGIYQSGANTILKVVSSEAATTVKTLMADSAVNTGMSAIETINDPIYLRREFLIRPALVLGAMFERYACHRV